MPSSHFSIRATSINRPPQQLREKMNAAAHDTRRVMGCTPEFLVQVSIEVPKQSSPYRHNDVMKVKDIRCARATSSCPELTRVEVDELDAPAAIKQGS